MKKLRLFQVLLLCCIFASCNDEIQNEVNVPELSLIEEIRNIKHLSTPPPDDKPHTIIEFHRGEYQYETQKFYNTEGFENLDISLNTLNNDTLSITLYEYDQKTLISKKFYLWNDLLSPSETYNYFYNQEGGISQILRNDKNFERYHYLKGKIERINLGADESFFYEFTYADDKIIRQVYRTITDIEYPIMDWKYVYDETGNLISKDLIRNEEISNPMFTFEYDSRNRLIESKEYDLFFDPYLMVRKVYEYTQSTH